MGYWKNGTYEVSDPAESFNERVTVLLLDDGDIPMCFQRHTAKCAQDHMVWAVDSEEALYGDGSAPGYQRYVVEYARDQIEYARHHGIELNGPIYVLEHRREMTVPISGSAVELVQDQRERRMLDQHRRVHWKNLKERQM